MLAGPMYPDIDSLALFVQAAERRSLSKAAEASHIGIGAASRRISLLEEQFKAALFERSPRGLLLTAAGTALLAQAKSVLLQMNTARAVMKDYAAGRRGALRVVANSSAIAESLPGDLAAFGRLYPDVNLVIEEMWSPDIVRGLLSGEVDVGIVVEGGAMDGLLSRRYRRDRLAIVAPADHALARLDTLRFDDVLDHDLIALEATSSMMRLLADQALRLGRAMQLRVQVRGFEGVCRMVQAGLGVGVLPLEAAVPLAQGLGLVARPLSEDWAERSMLVCVRRDRPSSALVPLLFEHLGSIPPGAAAI